MTYEVYRYIFIIAAILCGIMFILSALLFILLKVPKLISDLSGITAKNAIKNIRKQNEATGDKYHKASAINEARGKLTDKISASGEIQSHVKSMQFGINTSKIAEEPLAVDLQTTVLCSDETSVLENTSNETTVLSEVGLEETQSLNVGFGETSVLNETSILNQNEMNSNSAVGIFEIEYDITFVHTNEIIQ